MSYTFHINSDPNYQLSRIRSPLHLGSLDSNCSSLVSLIRNLSPRIGLSNEIPHGRRISDLMSWSGKQFRTSGEPYLECTEGNSRVGDRLCVVPDQRLRSDGRHEKKAVFPGLLVLISALSVVPVIPQAESIITNLRIVTCKTTISTGL